jgi:DNA helicase-2/ATP-dependent DNA helicase PcrA
VFSVAEYLDREHDIKLSEQQKAAVEETSASVLLLAVPGSGKTTVLVSRIAHFILNQKIHPDRMLILTFSRESARDMKRRFNRLFGTVVDCTPRFSTIHSFCYRLLQWYSKTYHRNFPAVIQEQARGILRGLYLQVNGEYISDDLLEDLMNDIGLVKNKMLSKEDLLDYEVSTDHFSEIMDQYDRIKKENGWMDYDDMLTFSYEILKKVSAVREHFSNAYDVIMVDEAQDTSTLQHAIIRLITRNNSIFMVGDEDQCIYSFRGADPNEMLTFSDRYPGGKVLKIEQNYRSSYELVAAADRLIQINQMRYPKHMICDNKRDHSIHVIQLDDYGMQYAKLLHLLEEEHGTVGILYRNNESAIPILDLLLSCQIPYDIKDYNLGFFNSFVVRDLEAYLRLSLNPCDLEAFEQIYFQCGCSKSVFRYVVQNISQYSSVFDAAADSPGTATFLQKKWLRYGKLLTRIRQKPPKEAIDLIEDQLGYQEYLKKKFNGKSHFSSILSKMSMMKYLAGRRQSVEEFLFSFSALKDKLSDKPNRSSGCPLLLSSIHSSKGLEFDTVFLVDFIDGILPSQQALDDLEYDQREEFEGEVRLFYVAVTRAKTKLVIFTSDYCNNERVAPCRFLSKYLNQKHPAVNTKNADAATVPKGTRVKHRFFGTGIVTGGIDDRIQIYFERYGAKELSYDFCLKTRMIKFIDEK